MLNRIILVALIGALIFSSGCTCFVSSPQPYGPRVTGDGTGGAIVVYEDIKDGKQHDFYVQRISPEGDILWGDNGVLVGSGYKYWDSFHDLHIVSDGYGGALVSWLASASSEQRTYATYVVRVDAEGDILWKKEVRAVDHMISDGAGGAIIATDYKRTLFIIKIDSEGNFPWGEDGVYVRREGYCDHSLGVASDGSGGAIFIWQELQTEPGPEPHRPKTTNRIFAQRIDAEGSLPWGQEGVLLYTTPEEAFSEEPEIISDGSGGAIVVWMQVPEGRIEEGSPKALLRDIYTQRVDAYGNALWMPNGIPLDTHKAGGFPNNHLVISDGVGGAIVIWGGWNQYIQKIDAEGTIIWQPGGVEVNAHSSPQKAVSDGSGGLLITFSRKEAEAKKSRLWVQRIDTTGRTMWPGNGTLVTGRATYTLAYDEHGGLVVVWGSGKSTFKSEKSYVQRIDSEGKLLWGDEGIRLNP